MPGLQTFGERGGAFHVTDFDRDHESQSRHFVHTSKEPYPGQAACLCMPPNPTCPNCGRPMTCREVDSSVPNDQAHIFECMQCNVVYMTEDHLPVSGVPVQ